MRTVAVFVLLLLLQACAAPASPVGDCLPIPVLPAKPTPAQRGHHTEALVALHLRCAGVTE